MSEDSKKSRGSGQFGETEYRAGALGRLAESYRLLRDEHFAGSVYLAGRGVEGMLRAVIWKHDAEIRQRKKSLDTGDDLREVVLHVYRLGVWGIASGDKELKNDVQDVGPLWSNNMRFASSKLVERRWRALGEVHKRRTMKQAARDFFDASDAIIRRCEVICQRTSFK